MVDYFIHALVSLHDLLVSPGWDYCSLDRRKSWKTQNPVWELQSILRAYKEDIKKNTQNGSRIRE